MIGRQTKHVGCVVEGRVWFNFYLSCLPLIKAIRKQLIVSVTVFNVHCYERPLLIGLEPYYCTLPRDASLCCANNKCVALENSPALLLFRKEMLRVTLKETVCSCVQDRLVADTSVYFVDLDDDLCRSRREYLQLENTNWFVWS